MKPLQKTGKEAKVNKREVWISSASTEAGTFEVAFRLWGCKGAVQFKMISYWTPMLGMVQSGLPLYMGGDLSYHAHDPVGQNKQDQEPDICTILKEGRCYLGGMTSVEKTAMAEVLIAEGSDGVWRQLEAFYYQTFGEEVQVVNEQGMTEEEAWEAVERFGLTYEPGHNQVSVSFYLHHGKYRISGSGATIQEALSAFWREVQIDVVRLANLQVARVAELKMLLPGRTFSIDSAGLALRDLPPIERSDK